MTVPTINKVQAQALGDLMWEGKQVGGNVEPPKSVQLVGIGKLFNVGKVLAQNRDGSHAVEGGEVPFVDDPDARTLGVLADDGRAWQIVTAGITWPCE